MSKPQPFLEATRRRSCQGALWLNYDKNGNPFYSASITRSYQDENDAWKNEKISVPLDDIPKLTGILRELEARAYRQMEVDYKEKKAREKAVAQATAQAQPSQPPAATPVAAGVGADDNF